MNIIKLSETSIELGYHRSIHFTKLENLSSVIIDNLHVNTTYTFATVPIPEGTKRIFIHTKNSNDYSINAQCLGYPFVGGTSIAFLGLINMTGSDGFQGHFVVSDGYLRLSSIRNITETGTNNYIYRVEFQLA